MKKLFNAQGYISTRKLESKRHRKARKIEDSQTIEMHPDVINFCLNCKKEKCTGNCDDIKSIIAQTRLNIKNNK